MSNYVIITPAHNEEAFIERTLNSVISQSCRPIKWVIVNDASTDRTCEIIQQFTNEYDFIELVNLDRPPGRHFGNKVKAFNAGLEQVKDLHFNFIGNLDADVSFDSIYFEKILQQFFEDPNLGLAGGMVHSNINDQFISQDVALDSVAGAVQFFRKNCFNQIGGYRALPNGGIDAAAEIAVRMHGWKTATFPNLPVHEHRLTGSATASPFVSRVKEGKRLYSLGYDPLFFFVRCLYRLRSRPMIVGSGAALYGYMSSAFKRNPLAVPIEQVRFLRNEQRKKLKHLLGLKPS